MSALHVVVVLLPASAALAMLFIVSFAFSGPRVRGRRAFGVLALFVGLWCLMAAAEYLSVEFSMRKFFGQCIYLGAAFAPAAWFIFACRYTGIDRWLNPPAVAVLYLLPATTALLAFSNDLHGLIWSEVSMVLVPLPDLTVTYGWWFGNAHLPYSYALTIAGLVVLISRFFGDIAAYRRQIAGVLLSATLVFAVNVFYVFSGSGLYGLDPTPLVASVFTFGLAVSLFRGFLGTAPLSYREVFMAAGEGLIMLDDRHRIVDINPAAAALAATGTPVDSPFLGAFPWLKSEADGSAGQLPSIAQHDGFTFSVRQLPLLGSGGESVGFVVLIRDVTAEHRERTALQIMARIDSLTQALNRGAFVDTLNERLAQRPRDWPLALLYIDLNRFKQINDRHGHAAGDEVLRECAGRIESVLRPGDVLGRLGGDEFAVLLDRADESVAASLAERFAGRFEAPFLLPGLQLRVSASIGYAMWPVDSHDVDGLLDIADRRMYRQKRGAAGDSRTAEPPADYSRSSDREAASESS